MGWRRAHGPSGSRKLEKNTKPSAPHALSSTMRADGRPAPSAVASAIASGCRHHPGGVLPPTAELHDRIGVDLALVERRHRCIRG